MCSVVGVSRVMIVFLFVYCFFFFKIWFFCLRIDELDIVIVFIKIFFDVRLLVSYVYKEVFRLKYEVVVFGVSWVIILINLFFYFFFE